MKIEFNLSRSFAIAAVLPIALFSCGKGAPVAVEGASFEVPGTGSSPEVLHSAEDATGSAAPFGAPGGAGKAAAGVLTAGTWDDNVNLDFFVKYRDSLKSQQGVVGLSKGAQDAAHESAARAARAKKSLEVALVIDTTGSMGDEILYLQSEFLALSQKLSERFPSVPQRWAVVAYRDISDQYIVRGADFGTSVSWFQGELGKLSAGGGGDYPEAPEQALEQASKLSWTQDEGVARIVFWVADAPHHTEKTEAMTRAIVSLQKALVHVYPVASSGVDEITEYTMRATAQFTRGRYLFLTNDSGVGSAHKEPTIPCYWVTKLDAAIERSVASELTGVVSSVDPSTVLRSQGDPKEGRCVLSDGTNAVVF